MRLGDCRDAAICSQHDVINKICETHAAKLRKNAIMAKCVYKVVACGDGTCAAYPRESAALPRLTGLLKGQPTAELLEHNTILIAC